MGKDDNDAIKQDGKTYRQSELSSKWVADKDWKGDDKVETDFFGNPKIERDFFGNQKIEKDWKGDPKVRPDTVGDCFIATVVYGGTAPQLDTLRWYRDNVLNKNYFGRSFVKLYYGGLGGKVAKLIGHIPGAVPLVRKRLDNLVEKYSQYNNKRI
ncbi:MAG: hypothetical protein KKF74_02495 [Nanoarchaeota archaeon]|nr:hypothetical protein [Nanoarchaeota archaeon]